MGYDHHWAGSAPGARHHSRASTATATSRPPSTCISGPACWSSGPSSGCRCTGWPGRSTARSPDAVNVGRGKAWALSDHLGLLADLSTKPTLEPVEVVERLLVRTGDGWQAIYYDSPATLTPKLALANERGPAGAGFWALGYERGLPGYTDLIAKFAAGETLSDG